jgi:hypothetical protein
MFLISVRQPATPPEQEELDQFARSVVLDTYRNAAPTSPPSDAFAAALTTYMDTFPHIPKELAAQAVAAILTDGEL